MGKKGKPKYECLQQRGNGSFRIDYNDAEGNRHWETLTAKDGISSVEDAAKLRR